MENGYILHLTAQSDIDEINNTVRTCKLNIESLVIPRVGEEIPIKLNQAQFASSFIVANSIDMSAYKDDYSKGVFLTEMDWAFNKKNYLVKDIQYPLSPSKQNRGNLKSEVHVYAMQKDGVKKEIETFHR